MKNSFQKISANENFSELMEILGGFINDWTERNSSLVYLISYEELN